MAAVGNFPAGRLTPCRSTPRAGDAALLALAGFAVEGRPADDLIDPWAVRLTSYQETPASPVTSSDLQAFVRTHKRTSYTGPGGSLIPKAD